MKKMLALFLLSLSLVLSAACSFAEQADAASIGHFPQRGMSLPMTAEDEAMGLHAAYFMGATNEIRQLPILEISYTDEESINALLSESDQNAIFESEEAYYAFLNELLACNHTLYQIALFDADYVRESEASGGMLADAISLDSVTVLTENDGYCYLLLDAVSSLTYDDPALGERVAAAARRAKELIDTASYEPVVFGPDEAMTSPDAFPPFATQDLDGNTVTNDVFSGKDLTVVNIWGTYCSPCIDEMPELAAWSASMPDNVQLIGLVCDLSSSDDAETLELAKAICEATGADAYPSLIASADFVGLLSGVIGVPTTLFIDGSGAFVAEPVVGANVPLCKKTVEDYLNAL